MGDRLCKFNDDLEVRRDVMKNYLLIATLSIAIAVVIKRVSSKRIKSITVGDVDSYPDWVKEKFLVSGAVVTDSLQVGNTKIQKL